MSKLKEKVFQTIGTASMCWIPRPDDMVFDSTLAEQIGQELWEAIEQENAKLRAMVERLEKVREEAVYKEAPAQEKWEAYTRTRDALQKFEESNL